MAVINGVFAYTGFPHSKLWAPVEKWSLLWLRILEMTFVVVR